MLNVYYLTREGKSCKTEYIEKFSQALQNEHGFKDREIMFIQGNTLNDIATFIKHLSDDEESVVLFSTPEETYVFKGVDNIKTKLIPDMQDMVNSGLSTWEVMNAIHFESKQIKAGE